jgi:alpha-1,6-mannosyltransferase
MTATGTPLEVTIAVEVPRGTAPGKAAAAMQVRGLWALCGLLTIGFAGALAFASRKFGYDRDVADMPVLAFAGAFVSAGLAFAFGVPRLIQKASTLSPANTQRLVAIMIATGLIARLVLFASDPILEDDYHRYLWDGAVTAQGFNPYTTSPRAVVEAGDAHPLAGLAAESGHVLRRINHPLLTTIYPPVTEAAFALAYKISPWSLTAWRGVLLGCDAAILAILLSLLKTTGRSPLWAALYWWNPLVLKEGFNSAHMEPVAGALVMLTLLLVAKRRPVMAAAALAVAAGAKLWPALLLPIVIRAAASTWRQVFTALGVFGTLTALWAVLYFSAGLGDTSGLVAYAESWKTNSAHFPALNAAAAPLLGLVGMGATAAALVVKGCLACLLAGFALHLARAPIASPSDLIVRCAFLIAALVLVSPAQYPWYVMWVLPFAVFWPSRAALLMAALVPLYYASFHFIARDTFEAAGPIIVALIWVPVWIAFALDARFGGSWRIQAEPAT